MVLSLARNPASCWSSRGVMSTTFLMGVGGVERVAGEDPHDGEEARHDRLHHEVAAATERRELRRSRQFREHRCPQHEARQPGRRARSRPGPGRSERPGRRLRWSASDRDHGDDGHRGERPHGHAQEGVDRCGPREPRISGLGVPSTRSGGTARIKSRRWRTSAIRTSARPGRPAATSRRAPGPRRRGERQALARRRPPEVATRRRQVDTDQPGQGEQPEQVEVPVERPGDGRHDLAAAVGSG